MNNKHLAARFGPVHPPVQLECKPLPPLQSHTVATMDINNPAPDWCWCCDQPIRAGLGRRNYQFRTTMYERIGVRFQIYVCTTCRSAKCNLNSYYGCRIGC